VSATLRSAVVRADGDDVVELLVHDALAKGAIVLVGLVLLSVGLAVAWRVWGRGPHDRG